MYTDTAHRPNPVDPLLDACEPSRCLRFGEVAITSLIILHPRLGDERFPVGQRPHHIGKILMRLPLKRVANGERCMFWDWQSVCARKLRANVATCVGSNLRMIVKPFKDQSIQEM